MNKLAIAAEYRKLNYGTVLQSYALQQAIENLGYSCDIICTDKLKTAIARGRRRFYFHNSLNLHLYLSKYGMVKHRVRRFLNRRFRICIAQRRDAFHQFIEERLQLSAPVSNFDDCKCLCNEYGAVIVGSDQLWLPVNICGGFFTLSYVPRGVKKLSYATSFGVADIPKWLHPDTGKFLRNMDALSVREQSGQKIVTEIAQREATLVCDPTMLLTSTEWNMRLGLPSQVTENYIFCYFLGDNPRHRTFANELKRITGLSIIVYRQLDNYIRADENFGDEAPYNVGPLDFVRTISSAKYVCTDSFHGCVFSILYNREFFVFERFSNQSNFSTNSRIGTLLESTGLPERLISDKDYNLERLLHLKIEYAHVNTTVDALRISSLSFLQSALQKVRNENDANDAS